MGKLTHIDDSEMEAAQQLIAGKSTQAKAEFSSQEPEVSAQDKAAEAAKAAEKPKSNSAAQSEEDFHGLSSGDSMGAMHGTLVAVAVVVFIAAILYIVNSWVHFI